jgi:hypothetical protein
MSHDKSDTGDSPGRERGVRRKIVDTDRKEKRTRYIKEQIDYETSKIISCHYSLQKSCEHLLPLEMMRVEIKRIASRLRQLQIYLPVKKLTSFV